MSRDDLDVATLAALVGGQLEQVDKLTIEPVNKSAMDRSGGKSNRLDPRSFIKQPQQTSYQALPPQPTSYAPPVITDQITIVPIPDELKEQAKKYMAPPSQPPAPAQQIVMGNIQTQNGGINTPLLLLEIDKKLDTIIEKLELICKTAKIVRK